MITPGDSPSSPENFAGVTPHGRGPAPYDIQAPQADLSAVTAAAMSEAMSRQPPTEALLSSPQGYRDFNITAGFAGSDGETWPGDTSP